MGQAKLTIEEINLLGKVLSKKKKGYRDDQITDNSHYDDPIDKNEDRPYGHGNSRIAGDASPEVQLENIGIIIKKAQEKGLSAKDIAYLLAIAHHESGFNHDAAAGTTSASGLGQFIDSTGAAFGLDDSNRWDPEFQAKALVDFYIQNKLLAEARGQGLEYIYKYHHDGPTLDFGGLEISRNYVLPMIPDYEQYLQNPIFPDDLPSTPNLERFGPPQPYGPYLPEIFGPFQNGEGAGSPLVLDMDGDGIELAAVNGAGSVYFDIDNDGFAEASGWVSGGDALLAVDRNGNGVIDAQNELFGNNAAHANGFEALKVFDSNKDNKITSADAEYNKLRLWIDANADGISQAGELHTLASKNVTSIDLNYTDVHETVAGNDIKQRATATIGGQVREIADVWFTFDDVNTVYGGDYTLDVRTLFLPTLRGYGTLPDLHIAMSKDEALLLKVQALTAMAAKDVFAPGNNLEAKITEILYLWAGVEGIDPAKRSAGFNVDEQIFDSRKLVFLETMMGQAFRDDPRSLVNPGAEPFLERSWNAALTHLTTRLLAQTGHLEQLVKGVIYNPVSDEMSGTYSLNLSGLSAIKPVYGGDVDAYLSAWDRVVQSLHTLVNLNTLSAADKSAINAMIVHSAVPGITFTSFLNAIDATTEPASGNDAANVIVGNNAYSNVTGNGGNDTLYGFGGWDILSGGAGNDRIFGMHGNDWLYGNEGDDTISGGEGNDSMEGGGGNDTYLYASVPIDGIDRISDASGTDTIRFGSALTAANIRLGRGVNTYDLNVFVNGEKEIVVSNYFLSDSYRVEKIAFANGTSLTLGAFTPIEGTHEANTINGADNALLLDDLIYAHAGDDTINGGKGDDILYGGGGNDTYIYSAGAGQGRDIVRDDEGAADRVQLGSGYTSANVVLERVGIYDLAIKSGGQVLMLIEGQFSQNGSIETLVYGNGASLNLMTYRHTVNGTDFADTLNGTSFGAGGDILNGLGGDDAISGWAGDDTINGGDGNDTLNGDEGSDTISGGAGNDEVNGGYGNDTVIYESGLDRFYDYGGTDTIRIANTAITAANMTLRRASSNWDSVDLDILLNGAHAFTIKGQFGFGTGYETIRFANGTSFNLSTVSYANEGTANAETLRGIGYGGNPNDVIRGYGGDDSLYGYEGNDNLTGGTGNDYIEGGAGNDIYVYNAGDGYDSIRDSAGTDVIQLGSGFVRGDLTWARDAGHLDMRLKGVKVMTIYDHFWDTRGVETVKFADGSTLSLTTLSFTVNGTNNSWESVSGTDNAHDTLNGLAGDDNLAGYGGNDTLTGGTGSDSMQGGTGNDTYVFRAGDSAVVGAPDHVVENFNEGTDTIRLTGGILPGNVRMWSEGGYGGIVIRYSANDFIKVSGIYDSGSGGYLPGVERISFDNSTVWDLTKSAPMVDTDEAHTLEGFAGNDSLDGRGGDDIIYGHNGNDTITGGTGTDYLAGGKGDDIYVFKTGDSIGTGSLEIVHETLNEGTDTIRLTGGILPGNVRMWSEDGYGGVVLQYAANDRIKISGVTDAAYNSMPGIERIVFDNGTIWDLTKGLTMTDTDDAHYLEGFATNDILDGRGGDDVIYGLAGNDVLRGGTGHDNLTGGDGNDVLYGEAGDDVLYGDTGDDLYVYSGGKDTIYESGGTDTLLITGGRTINDLTLETGSNLRFIVTLGVDEITLSSHDYGTPYQVETLAFEDGFRASLANTGGWIWGTNSAQTLTGTASADVIVARGGNDTVRGGSGNDLIHGGSGDDTLYGGNDIDEILGGIGNDGIFGEAGNDRLIGGAGLNKLSGGTGSDTFVFQKANAFDTPDEILDFKTAEGDRLDIADLLDLHNPLTDAIAGFVRITETGTNSFLAIDADGGANNFVTIAQLTGVTNLTAGSTATEAELKALVTNGSLII
ncbi:MAG: calcium-binding protein [Candidatus Melainabacteria bacterium]|nr:calcium-binding protein [Candidatus Melainabacteria bacterium]